MILFGILFIIGLLLLPLLIEHWAVNGVFGIEFSNTYFGADMWFPFWGSYIGAVVTVAVLWLTIQYNRKETEKRLREYDIDRKYDDLSVDIDKLHSYITLENVSNANTLYYIKVNAALNYAIMKKCIKSFEPDECNFLSIFKQLLGNYLDTTSEFDSVKLTNENIVSYTEKYKELSKQISRIMHSKRNELDNAFVKAKELVEEKRVHEKSLVYKNGVFLFKRNKSKTKM